MNVTLPLPSVIPTRTMADRSFRCHDGTRIAFRHWKPAAAGPYRRAILLLHRGHEHGGRMAHLVTETGMHEYDFYAWDARGHGRSGGERGHSPDVATLVRDLDGFVRHIGESDGIEIEDIGLIAQSAGAVVAAAWGHDYAPNIRAMVLAAPAFDIRLYVPFARRMLAARHRLRGDFRVRSFVTPRHLTRDIGRADSYMTDPAITPDIPAGLLLDLYATAERVVSDARAITVPTQVLISGDDRVVNAAPQHRFFVSLGAAQKERLVLEGFRHDTLGEAGRDHAVDSVARFLRDAFSRPTSPPFLLDAHRAGHTRAEADALESPVPKWTAADLRWRATRAALALGGKLSHGLALGRAAGFDSGASLDYVYRDTAGGFGPLGRMIDRRYLDAPGWRGIRTRKQHLEELIAVALGRLKDAGQPRRILDIAAGHGRYVLDAAVKSGAAADSILLRDASRRNVDAGRRMIAERRLETIARFELGDAFDGDDLAALEPRPTLAVVSGLYELFADNAPVRRSLDGLARAVPTGGYLVYTGQPWHPQIELIARALTSHRDGRPWVMRRRTQAEMDQLVAAAGFRKIEQRIDRWGIFTVSLAERTGEGRDTPGQ